MLTTNRLTVAADVAAYLRRFDLTLDGLLTLSNPKLAKGSATAHGVILHHLPARALAAAIRPDTEGATAPRSYLPELRALADREGLSSLALNWNGCPWATAGCAAGCLNWSGHGGLSSAVAAARGRRTLAMLANPQTYARAVLWAIARQWHVAQTKGLPLAVRLRGTDEGPRQGWHRLRFDLPVADAVALLRRYGFPVVGGAGTIAEFCASVPNMHLYDYSKAPLSGPLGLIAQRRAGWNLTASFTADRLTAVADGAAALRAGFRLAVPVALAKGAPIPDRLTLRPYGSAPLTVPCIDGDATDHRWADPAGVAVILRTKRSRGAGPEAKAFSLEPHGHSQPLADGTVSLRF
jgi:hypothetical protein